MIPRKELITLESVCAIICEYNPLHNGHLEHIKQTRKILGCEAGLIAVLSGHAVQRGEFPILTKAARTQMALRAGFDLVFELPTPWSCSPAERFARGAVSIIAVLGTVTHLSFGTETEDLDALRQLAGKTPEVYPKDIPLASAWPTLFPKEAHLFAPNNILAIEYLRALNALAPHIQPILIPRKQIDHDGETGSALAYRKRIMAGGSYQELPFADIVSKEIMDGRSPIALKHGEKAVLSYLRRMTAEDLANLPDVNGGLDRRLSKAITQAGSLEELYALTKSKRYTMSRIRRVVLSAFLGFCESDALTKPNIRLLGIGRNGDRLLPHINTSIISRPAAHKEGLAQEATVTDQMSLCMPRVQPMGMEWRTGVMHLEKPRA